jgi:hypothetical protein
MTARYRGTPLATPDEPYSVGWTSHRTEPTDSRYHANRTTWRGYGCRKGRSGSTTLALTHPINTCSTTYMTFMSRHGGLASTTSNDAVHVRERALTSPPGNVTRLTCTPSSNGCHAPPITDEPNGSPLIESPAKAEAVTASVRCLSCMSKVCRVANGCPEASRPAAVSWYGCTASMMACTAGSIRATAGGGHSDGVGVFVGNIISRPGAGSSSQARWSRAARTLCTQSPKINAHSSSGGCWCTRRVRSIYPSAVFSSCATRKWLPYR